MSQQPPNIPLQRVATQTEAKSPNPLPYTLEDLEKELQRRKRNSLTKWFPDTGPFARSKYPKHMEFIGATKEMNEILFLAANKVGKTLVGSYMGAVFATGKYPKWWHGRRFNMPTLGWACNKTGIDCRDINQLELLGQPGQWGTGMIPADDIIDIKSKPSVPDAVETVYVRHITGGQSMINFKSYDQGREKFQGRNIHWIWPDEEVPAEVYNEMVMRIMVTDGLIFCTYTPIMGLTEITVQFLKECVNKSSLPVEIQISSRDNKDGHMDTHGLRF